LISLRHCKITMSELIQIQQKCFISSPIPWQNFFLSIFTNYHTLNHIVSSIIYNSSKRFDSVLWFISFQNLSLRTKLVWFSSAWLDFWYELIFQFNDQFYNTIIR
jgi:hypothetical protein